MSKKYKVIAKVGNTKFVKYHVNDLLKFTEFLDKSFPFWRYFNVFGKESREQVGNFTNKKRPQKRFINDK